MEMNRFGRDITHCNICTIGWTEANATALGITIANVLNTLIATGNAYSADNEDNLMENENETFAVNAVSVNYETENRNYTHIDFMNPVERAKGLLLLSLDGAVLVVNALEGITSDISEQLSLANMAGVHYLAVFVDNCDLIEDYEQLEQLGDEIRELLDETGYCGEDTFIVYGSSKEAGQDPESEWGEGILELIDMLDECIPEPESDRDKPFIMPVEDVFAITGRGTVATGKVESGVVKVNDRLEVVGFGAHNQTVTATGIEMFRKLLDFAEPGDNIGLLLRGIDRFEIKRGQVIANVGACESSAKFTAVIHFTKKSDLELIAEQTKLNFLLRTAVLPRRISVLEDDISCNGQYAKITVELTESVAMNPGMALTVAGEHRNILGVGKIIEIL